MIGALGRSGQRARRGQPSLPPPETPYNRFPSVQYPPSPLGKSSKFAMDAILRDLTDPQRQAVTHIDGPLLIWPVRAAERPAS